MRRLHLDFRRRPREGGHAPTLLLVLAMLVAVLVAGRYAELSVATAEHEARVVQLQRELARQATTRPVPADERATAAELKQAAAVSERLALPWDGLLRGIERAAQRRDRDVALLSIRPDAHRRLVKITGEARDFQAMIRYAKALAQDPNMDDVYIESHQIQEKDPQHPVRFEIAAHWRVVL
jgi:Tfp pilus assembly protein PilN